MFKRILVPCSESMRGEVALRLALALAQKTALEVIVLSAPSVRLAPQDVPQGTCAVPGSVAVEGANADADAGRAHALKLIARLRAQSARVRVIPWEDQSMRQISALSRQLGVELILLAPKDRCQLELLWYPRSVAHTLADLGVPLLILPEQQQAATLMSSLAAPIVVALDGSESDADALAFAVGWSRLFGATLLLVSVLRQQTHTPLGDEVERSLREALAHAQAQLRQALVDTSTTVGVDILFGRPAEALRRYATEQRAGLTVIGAHHQHGEHRYFTGDVAGSLVRQAPTTVALLPDGAAPARGV